MRVRRLSLLALLAATAFPVAASAGPPAGLAGRPAGERVGLSEARVAELPKRQRRADPDGDGLRTWHELDATHTNPRLFDTDGDGFGDGAELAAGTDPRNPASFPHRLVPPASLATLAPGPAEPGPGSEEPDPEPDETPPQTTIEYGPAATTISAGATFGFSSNEGGSTFECKLDSGPWTACTSPRTFNSLALGTHTFSVTATDAAGNVDSSPAGRSWTIESASAGCTQTLAPGANLSNAISTASGGDVICLDGGSWSFDVTNANESSPVTVRSADGATASVGHSIVSKSKNLRFEGLHFTNGLELLGSTNHVEVLDNEFSGEFGIRANGEDANFQTEVTDVLIEGNYIHDLDFTGSEGTTGGYGMTLVNGVERFAIRGNTIKSVANDYIQSASPVDFTVDGNTFLGPSLRFGHASVHQDLWQIFGGGDDVTFTNNVARNTGTHESLLFQEGTFHDVRVENNLFENDSDGYTCSLYPIQGLIFRHNTIVDSHWGCLFRDNGGAAGSGYQVDHNIFVGTEENSDFSTQSRAAGWGTYDYNVSEDGAADEPHSVSHWSPSWVDTVDYSPLGLPFAAGYAVP